MTGANPSFCPARRLTKHKHSPVKGKVCKRPQKCRDCKRENVDSNVK
ncbi:MAG: hypothetical protein WC325_13885 [Candidatus Bathyarchaeia archaeon]